MRDDLSGSLGPDEWFAALVPPVDEHLDGADEVLDGCEGASADRMTGDDPEEDLDDVPLGPGRRGEVQRDPLLRAGHAATLGCL